MIGEEQKKGLLVHCFSKWAISPRWGERETPGGKSGKREAIAHETCKIFFLLFTAFFFAAKGGQALETCKTFFALHCIFLCGKRGMIADEMCKTFVFALDHIFLCELDNSHSSVALTFAWFLRTQAYQGEGRL